eukprot:6182959-Pleurochrysis_carterae.AAC.1
MRALLTPESLQAPIPQLRKYQEWYRNAVKRAQLALQVPSATRSTCASHRIATALQADAPTTSPASSGGGSLGWRSCTASITSSSSFAARVALAAARCFSGCDLLHGHELHMVAVGEPRSALRTSRSVPFQLPPNAQFLHC